MWCYAFYLLIALLAIIIIRTRRPANFPPGPPGLPIIGNILELKRLKEELKLLGPMFCELAATYGPVVGLRTGPFSPALIVVSGKEAVHEMLARPEFDGRQDGFAVRHRTNDARRGVVYTDGKVWSDNRRFALKTLKDFGFGKLSMEAMILEDAVSIVNVIEKLSKKGPIENICEVTFPALINSLWYIVSGQRYELSTINPRLKTIYRMIHHNFKNNNGNSRMLNTFPFLRYIVPSFREWDKRVRALWDFFAEEVARHKETRNENEVRDFIDAYLKEMDTHGSATFNEDQLTAVVEDLIIAGVETTNNNIGFVVIYLAARQDIQEKVHEELDRVIGKDILPSILAKNRLPYLNATLAEILRFANVAPTTILHRAMKTTTFRGFEIKANYHLIGNLASLHMDEEHWGDPHVFRPERFIDDKGNFVEDPWLISFGAGRRRCLGETLARNTFFLITACLLQKFHFVLQPDSPEPSLTGVDGFTVSPPNVQIIALQRKDG